MILVDLNQVMISNLMQQVNSASNGLGGPGIETDLIRHMVFNSIRMYKSKFGKKYGDIIICCDDKNYWRKQTFPHYKANRKKFREESDYDWNLIFESLNEIREDIRQHSPYKVIQVETAEADDIIGAICKHVDAEQPLGAESILILSGDKDFQQLQQFHNVEQYSPIMKKFIKCVRPFEYLAEHTAKGDRGDGVPNILSPDSVFVDGQRQKPLTKKRLAEFIKSGVDACQTDEEKQNWQRNNLMVNLTMTPDNIVSQIIEQFKSEPKGSKRKLLDLFIAKKMKHMIELVEEF